jgi:ADP-ribosylglycohydrolase
VGLATGDALGAGTEFRPHQYFVEHPVRDMVGGGTWGLKSGQWTDDTSMALCLASSLISKKGYDPYDQMVRYSWWYKYGYLSSTGKCFDIGNATRDSLEEFLYRQKSLITRFNCSEDKLDYLSWDEIQSARALNINCSGSGVAGNGALMRLAPVPLFFYRSPAIAVEFSGHSGQITHGDQKAYDACRYYGALIVAALRGETKEQLLDQEFYSKHKPWFGNKELHPDILRVARGSYKNPQGYEGGIRGKGYIVNALEAALWAFWSDKGSFEKGALAAVNLGDDTDTTAAIYGQLAGAYYGYKSIPKNWSEKLYAHDLLVCIGQWLYYKGQGYNPVEKEQKMISSGQSPIITSSSQHQDAQARKSSMHFSGTNSSRTDQSGNTELISSQPRARDLQVLYHGSSRIPTHKLNETQISPRQPNTYYRSEDRAYTNQGRILQRPREQYSTYHSNVGHTLVHQIDPANDLESNIRYDRYIDRNRRSTSQNDNLLRDEANRRTILEPSSFNRTPHINSPNHGHFEKNIFVGNEQLPSSYNYPDTEYRNGPARTLMRNNRYRYQ